MVIFFFFFQYYMTLLLQGGQSCGQHDWVHEPVKSLLGQIYALKCKKTPHIFLHKSVSNFLLSLL